MIKYELINYCEFDKYATKAYSLIHNEPEDKNLGDITLVNEKEIADFNWMVGGSPCQDFSVAGKQEGAKWTCKNCEYEYNPLEAHYTERDKCPKCHSENIEKTRSSLLVEWLRILREKKPSIAVYENVKNIVGKRFKETFDLFIQELHEYGYNTYWKVLNAKNYGIPQNRERVYLIIVKKDLDNGKFQFPEGFDNGIRLKDLLEKEVDEKYYISQDKTDKLIEQLKNKEVSNTIRTSGHGSTDRHMWDLVAVQQNRGEVKIKEDNICSCIDANYYKGLDNHASRTGIMQAGKLDINGNDICKRVYSPDGCSPTIPTGTSGNTMPKILEYNKLIQLGTLEGKGHDQNRRVYSKDGVCPTLNGIGNGGNHEPKILEEKELKFIGGIDTTDKWIDNDKDLSRNYKEGYRVYDSEGIACCQKSNGGGIGSYTRLYSIGEQLYYRIRKLIPLECFRLMGFDDKDFYILKENKISDTQCYKMAGNSIVVDVLYYIYLELYKAMPYLFEDVKLGSFFSGIGAFEKALERLKNNINNGIEY